MQFEINLTSYRAALHELCERIRALKGVLGTRWEKPMAAEQRELSRLKVRVTELCALRAFARGRLHLRQAPLNAHADWDAVTYHRGVAERLAPSYGVIATLEKSA